MLEHLEGSAIRPERVAVIGAGGFVGAAVRRRLAAAGIDVLALGRRDVDLLAEDAAERLTRLLRPSDAVVAVSALAPVKNLDMLRDNVTMIRALVAALTATPPAHLVAISSDAVFADLPVPLTEESPKAPGSLHGAMHLMREIALAEIPAPSATLRPTLIYGVDDPHNGYGPNRFRRLAAAGEEIVLFGEGEERRDHVLVDDVAELVFRTLTRRSRGSLNCATGQTWSFREVASMVAGLHPAPVRIVGSPRRGPMPHNGYRPFDPSATLTAFPDFRYTPLPEGLAKVHAEAEGRKGG
jgi:UDP-glucose 4-epimerase